MFTQLRESHDITALFFIRRTVRHPHLNLSDDDTRTRVRQIGCPSIIIIIKIFRKEEVSVLIVVGRRDREIGRLSTLRINRLRFRLLLRSKRRDFQLTELQIRTNTEQGRSTLNQRGGEWQTNISGLHLLYDIVFLSFVRKINQLLVEIERRLRIIVHGESDTITHLTVGTQLNLRVEIEYRIRSVTLWNRRVVPLRNFKSESQIDRTLRLQLDTTRTENLIARRTDADLHVTEIEVLICIRLVRSVLLRPIGVHGLFQGIVVIFALIQHERGGNIHISHPRRKDIQTRIRIVLNRLVHIFGHLRISRRSIVLQFIISDDLRPPQRIVQRHRIIFRRAVALLNDSQGIRPHNRTVSRKVTFLRILSVERKDHQATEGYARKKYFFEFSFQNRKY